ncbi:MAG: hypothetical protein QW512_05925, partial [Thermofilaceae archaeon]
GGKASAEEHEIGIFLERGELSQEFPFFLVLHFVRGFKVHNLMPLSIHYGCDDSRSRTNPHRHCGNALSGEKVEHPFPRVPPKRHKVHARYPEFLEDPAHV